MFRWLVLESSRYESEIKGGNDSDEQPKPLRAFPSMLLSASCTPLAEDPKPALCRKAMSFPWVELLKG